METDICPVRLAAADGGPVAADVLGRRLFHLLDALESSRSMLNEVADHQTTDYRRRALPAQVSSVTMESPIELTLVLPVGVIGIFGVVYVLIKGGPIAYKTVQEGRLAGAQARRETALAEQVEIDNNLRGVVVQQAVRRYLEADGAEVTEARETSRRFDNALDQTIKHVEGLVRESVTGLELPASAALPSDEPLRPPTSPA